MQIDTPFFLQNLISINSALRLYQGSLGLRSVVSMGVGKNTGKVLTDYLHPDDVEAATKQCLQRLNAGIVSAQNSLRGLVQILTQYWAELVFRIHPFEDGNVKTARFLTLLLLRQRGLKISNFNLLDAYRRTEDLDRDVYHLKTESVNKNPKKVREFLDLCPTLTMSEEDMVSLLDVLADLNVRKCSERVATRSIDYHNSVSAYYQSASEALGKYSKTLSR